MHLPQGKETQATCIGAIMQERRTGTFPCVWSKKRSSRLFFLSDAFLKDIYLISDFLPPLHTFFLLVYEGGFRWRLSFVVRTCESFLLFRLLLFRVRLWVKALLTILFPLCHAIRDFHGFLHWGWRKMGAWSTSIYFPMSWNGDFRALASDEVYFHQFYSVMNAEVQRCEILRVSSVIGARDFCLPFGHGK